MATQTVTRPGSDQTLEKKIQRLREVYATGPEVGKTALEKVLGELTSFASTPVLEPRVVCESLTQWPRPLKRGASEVRSC